jgi:hypothetical protein
VQVYFGGNKSNRCPGEDSCDIFNSAGGDDRKAKADNACKRCPLLPTKPANRSGGSFEALEALVDQAARIRNYSLTPYPLKEWQMTACEFETYVMLDAEFRAFDDYLKHQQAETFGLVKSYLNPNG